MEHISEGHILSLQLQHERGAEEMPPQKHSEVLRGQVKVGKKWIARTKRANPYPAGLCRRWVVAAKRALRARFC